MSSPQQLSSEASPPSVHDPTEKAIAKKIEGIRWLLNLLYGKMTPEEENEENTVIMISAATQKHFELPIRTLHNAPRDPDRLRELLQKKRKQYEKAEDSEDIERLVTEIEMLKCVCGFW